MEYLKKEHNTRYSSIFLYLTIKMLTIKNITLKPIFENVNFEIEKWLVIISWPSWSWKTTFLKTIWWFIFPDKWEIYYQQNNEIFHIKQWKIVKQENISSSSLFTVSLGFHFQDYNLLDLDVKTNIELPFLIWKYQKDNNWINYLLEYFEIKNLLNKNINEISWWEKERVSIVKAFANKPHIVLLDEAGAALDERLKTKLYDFLLDYSKDNIVFLISHDKNFIDKLNLKEVYNWNFKISLFNTFHSNKL